MKKRIVSFILMSCLLAALTPALAATVGGPEDPLISRSYVDGTYSSFVLKEPLQRLKDAIAVLEYKVSAVSAGTSYASVNPGGSISVSSGGSFTFLSGSAAVSRLSGLLIDVTAGSAVSSGQALSVRHRYVAGGNTSVSITVSAAAKLSAMGSVTTGNISMAFTDVKSGAWYYNYVLYAYTNGLINGKSATTFAPGDNLTVAEAIKLAACMHQLYKTGAVTLVNGGKKWYSSYVEYAADNGIISKTYPNYDALITRDEFVNIFYYALPASEYAAINSVGDNAIPDVKTNSKYAAQIYAFYRAGILTGNDAKGTFTPGSNILRSEVAALVARMFQKDLRVSIKLG